MNRISKEDLRFLQELQDEMNSQETNGQEYPFVWVIKEKRKTYVTLFDHGPENIIDNSVLAKAMLDAAEGYDLWIDNYCCRSERELYQVLIKIFQEDDFSAYKVEMKNGKTVVRYLKMDGVHWDGLLEICGWLQGHTLYEVSLRFYEIKMYTYPGKFFLTYKEGMKHLQENKDIYSDEAYLYAMPLVNNNELDKLFKILRYTDFGNVNQKVYISGKITGTDDYLQRFALAEKELNEQGYQVVNPAYEGTKLPYNATYEDYMNLSFSLLKGCDVIYMLNGWEKSPGANREYGYALAKGMDVQFQAKKEKAYDNEHQNL